jgi:hypothetical protein
LPGPWIQGSRRASDRWLGSSLLAPALVATLHLRRAS